MNKEKRVRARERYHLKRGDSFQRENARRIVSFILANVQKILDFSEIDLKKK